MAYVPNASDVTQPTEDKTVESAALEFRTLKADVKRGLKFPASDAASYQGELPAADVRAGKFLYFNSVTGVPEAVAGTPNSPVTTADIENGAVTPAKLSTDVQYSMQGFRNRIINGDMRIDQRNGGASVSADGAFPCDRFGAFRASGTFTAQQSSVTPAGFTASILYTSTATTTTAYAGVQQIIEGNNIADFGWGSASAQSITLSFWVRSSLTGTFGGSLRNSASNRSYVFQYTIIAANTWEQKTVTIAGDTSGTWLTTNGAGIRVWFDTGSDTARLSTAGSWSSNDYLGVTGATRVTNTNGATFYITGVQLEAGSVATPFERRDYGRELMMCQRYYTNAFSGNQGALYATTAATFKFKFPVTMRTAPTMSLSSGTSVTLDIVGVVATSIASPGLGAISSEYGSLSGTTANSSSIGAPCQLTSNTIQASAEL
jgi:hypothetical protein